MSFSQNWETQYATGNHNSLWPWDDLVKYFMRSFSNVETQLRVLELGCGSGANVPFMFSHSNVEYIGIDGSTSAINNLKQRFSKNSEAFHTRDFSESFDDLGKFDLIFDRASITHNSVGDIKNIVNNIRRALNPGGIFLGIHWFSKCNSYSTKGLPINTSEVSTRVSYKDGPYLGIEPVHFFDEDEILKIFEGFRVQAVELISRESLNPSCVMERLSMYNFKATKAQN